MYDVIGNVVLESQINKVAIGDVRQALQLIENAYNNRLTQKNRMRFVTMYEDYQIGTYKWHQKK